MQSRLSIVATPIGNLEDITARALRILEECDTVLCEDTRVTKKLLSHFAIDTPVMSYHAHSGDAKYEKIGGLLEEGQHLALVSDAGTPAVSDPGAELVQYVRRVYGDTVQIEAIPGPSALAAALSVAGLAAHSFLFLGFPPHKKGRKTFFDNVAAANHPVIFYESPHRIMKALAALNERLSDTCTVTVCRELTKVHEEVVAGTPADILRKFEDHPEKVRGEFVVVVACALTRAS